MHKDSENSELETAAVRLYLDESGGQDPNTPHAVVGGMFIRRDRFLAFEDAWGRLLEDHQIVPPLHMKEFGRPHGRFAAMSDCCCRRFFLEAAEVISDHRVGTISVSISNEEYKQYVPKEARDCFSVYGMCFLLTAVGANETARNSKASDSIPFILDSGNPYADQVRKSHENIVILQRREAALPHIGSLTFANDKDFGALQAADLIAWTARRRATGIHLGYRYGALAALFEDASRHIEASWESEWVKQVGEYLIKSIAAENHNQE